MLPKPEYDSFYKFIVSAGVLLIAGALAFPWFALQMSDSHGSSGESTSSQSSPDPRREAIGDLALTTWPWISGLLAVVGGTATGYGLTQWKKRQDVLDDLHEHERDLLQKQVQDLSASDIAAHATAEAQLEERTEEDAEDAPLAGAQSLDREAMRSRILAVETRVLTLLQAGFKWTHRGRPHVTTGHGDRLFSVDLLLEARDEAFKDVLFEVKYLRGGLNIASYVVQIAVAYESYTTLTERPADAHLIFVLGHPARERDYEHREKDARTRFEEAQTTYNTPVTATFLREADLSHLDAADLRVRLPRTLGVVAERPDNGAPGT